MKINIGVYGSAREESISPAVLEWSLLLGHKIARSGHVLLTGGTRGVPGKCGEGCIRAGGIHLEIMPGSSDDTPGRKETLTVYSNMGVTGRSMLLANSADLVFAVMGGVGTLLEIIMSYLQKKVIVVVADAQRENDPDITALLRDKTETVLEGIRVEQGWLDSKPESVMPPIYVVHGLIAPELLVKIGLELHRKSNPGQP